MAPQPAATAPLTTALRAALIHGEGALEALVRSTDATIDERDGLLALLTIHDLDLAPIDAVGSAVRFQHHPAVAALRWRLEHDFEKWHDGLGDGDDHVDHEDAVGAVGAIRAIAARDLVPPIYRWLAESASMAEVIAFLAVEGGPDGGFDDLVALAQVGLAGEPKLELAR